MKKIILASLCLIQASFSFAQNKEISQAKDITQPGQINPALAGLQEDVFRLLTNTDLNDFSLMFEGKIPFKLGNYMLGYERFANDDVSESTFNITYGRTSKKDKSKKWRFRYGGSLEFSSRTSLSTPDSNANGQFNIVDLDGREYSFQLPTDLNASINYVNLEFGGAVQYDNLLISASIDNLLNPNVSLIEGEKRRLALNTNVMIGGFMHPTKDLTIYPSLIAIYQANEEYLLKGGVDINYKYANVSAGYLNDGITDALTASIGFHYKKTFFGLQYDGGLNSTINAGPSLQVFINSGIFKDRKLFKSDFAKQIGLFY